MTSGWFRMFSHLYSAKEFMLYVKSPSCCSNYHYARVRRFKRSSSQHTLFIFLDCLLHIWRSLSWCLRSCRPKVNHTLDKITFFEHFCGFIVSTPEGIFNLLTCSAETIQHPKNTLPPIAPLCLKDWLRTLAHLFISARFCTFLSSSEARSCGATDQGRCYI